MNVGIEDIVAHAVFPVAGAAALLVFRSRGFLRPDVFIDTKPRETGIVLMDLFIGVWIILGCSAMLSAVFTALNVALPSAEPPPTLREFAVAPLIGQAVTQLPVVLFLLWRVSQVPSGVREVGLLPRRPLREIFSGAFALLAAMPMVLGASAICVVISNLMGQKPPSVGHELLEKLLTSTDAVATTLMVISAVVFAPILEEIIFRGLVQSALLAWLGWQSRWLAIFIAAAVFSLIHAGVASWHVLPGLFILGLILGWLYEKHGSLLPSVVLHVLFNLANIGLGLLQVKE